MNFSKDFLGIVSDGNPAAIAVLPVLGVLWSDWGSPDRLVQTLERIERSHSSETGGAPSAQRNPPNELTKPFRQMEVQ